MSGGDMEIEADLGGVRSAAAESGVLAEQLRAARSVWDAATRAGESACGLPVVRRAFRDLQDAWFTEVGAHVAVLTGLRRALEDSADTYQRVDQGAARRLRAASGGE